MAGQHALWRPQLSESELSWAAGLFEGEGTVTITRSGKAGTRPIVSVANTDREVVEFFADRWRVNIKNLGSVSERAKEAFEWRLHASWQIEIFINQMLPFIRTRRVRDKMNLVLEGCKDRRQGARDPDYRARHDAVRQKVRVLNQRGVQNTTGQMPPLLPAIGGTGEGKS